jgi:hypothetical protein
MQAIYAGNSPNPIIEPKNPIIEHKNPIIEPKNPRIEHKNPIIEPKKLEIALHHGSARVLHHSLGFTPQPRFTP